MGLLAAACRTGCLAVQCREVHNTSQQCSLLPSACQVELPQIHQQAADVLCCCQAGACFGLSAAACRTGFLLGSQVSVLCIPVGVLAGAGLTSTGLMLQTCGLKDGNTVVVCTCAAVSSMVTGQHPNLLIRAWPGPINLSPQGGRGGASGLAMLSRRIHQNLSCPL